MFLSSQTPSPSSVITQLLHRYHQAKTCLHALSNGQSLITTHRQVAAGLNVVSYFLLAELFSFQLSYAVLPHNFYNNIKQLIELQL